MKKTTLALAVVAAMSVSAVQAEPTVLYGRVAIAADYTLNHYTKVQSHPNGAANGDTLTRGWDVVDAASRIGLKGGEDLGNGMSVFYLLEFAVNPSEQGGANTNYSKSVGTRLGYVGLQGDWGAVAIGRQKGQAHEKLRGSYGGDVFEQVAGGLGIGRTFGTAVAGSDHNGIDVMYNRVGNALTYASPDFNGLSFSAMVAMDSDSEAGAEKGIDLWELTGSYNYEGFGVNVAYQANENTGGDAWGIGAVYQNDMFYVAAGYAAGSTADKVNGTNPGKITSEDVQGWDVTGQFFFNDGMDTIRATYGRFEFDDRNDAEYDSWAVGYTHKLSERTRVWVEYADYDDATVSTYNGNVKNVDNDHLSIGIRHDF